MKYVQTSLLGGILAVLLLGAAPVLVGSHAGTEADPFVMANLETMKLSWDNTNVGRQIVAAVVVLTAVPSGVVTEWRYEEQWDKAAARHEAPIIEQARALADGLYKVQAKVVNESQVESALSDPVWVQKDWSVPNAPGGCIFSF
jgi:hypothetical protein